MACVTAKVPCGYSHATIQQNRTNYIDQVNRVDELELMLKTVTEELNQMRSELHKTQEATPSKASVDFIHPVINLVKKPSKEKLYIGQEAVLSKVQAIRRIITVDQENTSIEKALHQERVQQMEASELQYVPTRASEDLFVRCYLSFSRNRYHFVEKDFVLEIFDKAPQERTRWEQFLSYIVLANGCRVSELSRLSVQPSPKYFFDKSIACLSELEDLTQMQQIQICMLLALYLTYAFDYLDQFVMNTWELSGMAFRKMIQMGYHKKKSPTIENSLIVEKEKRLFWSVYAFDKLLSVSLGRPSSIADEDIDVSFPLSLESIGLDPKRIYELQMEQLRNSSFKMVPTSITYLVEVCKIRQIEGRINHLDYESSSDAEFQQHFDSINKSLEDWATSLPSKQSFNDGTRKEVTFDYLSLSYHRAKLFLLLIKIIKQDEPLPSSSHLLFQTLVAAGGICNNFKRIHRDSLFGYSVFSLHTIFLAGVTLVYCVWVLGNPPGLQAHNHIRACSKYVNHPKVLEITNFSLLYSFSERTREAESYRVLFETLIENILYNREPQEAITKFDGSANANDMPLTTPMPNMDDSLLTETKLFNFTFDDDFWKRLGIDYSM